MTHQALLLAAPVTIFIVVALVVGGLAFGQSYLAFNKMPFPVERCTHTGMSFLINTILELFKLAVVEQQLSGASWLGDIMGRGRGQGRNISANQKGFTILKKNIGVCQINPALSQALNLPAHQRYTRLEFLFDKVVVSNFTVLGNCVGLLFRFLFTHC